MAKDKPIPGRTAQPNNAPKIDLKGIVNTKGKNLAGPPRSAGLNPKSQPGKKTFNTIRRITGQGRNR
jgi:hypothetical protein